MLETDAAISPAVISPPGDASGLGFAIPIRRAFLVADYRDIVIAVDGKPVRQGADLRRAIRGWKPGDEVWLRVRRPEGGREIGARLGEVTLR